MLPVATRNETGNRGARKCATSSSVPSPSMSSVLTPTPWTLSSRCGLNPSGLALIATLRFAVRGANSARSTLTMMPGGSAAQAASAVAADATANAMSRRGVMVSAPSSRG